MTEPGQSGDALPLSVMTDPHRQTERWASVDPVNAAGYLLDEVIGPAISRWVYAHGDDLDLDSEGVEECACELSGFVRGEIVEALDGLEREARLEG